ncbi:hypothetical protein SAMN05421766_102101 [Zobellia uliginosa]|uniref:Uncharacterized protein n=1 Tax=Zobellia uliginosa TaxID=143224 RepID=A0ABY1KLB8_9FLAO|nr:hypothetical protein [Zobellia uliginosa]SIS47158.1 hypothetical protein SAMN05421766_102101 [Zobellia uliginosa]
MTRLRIGYRSIFNKKYEIELFDFLMENTDQFNTPYDGLDLWNSKGSETKVLQVEERIEYFHFMYVPIFPITHVWTLRSERNNRVPTIGVYINREKVASINNGETRPYIVESGKKQIFNFNQSISNGRIRR